MMVKQKTKTIISKVVKGYKGNPKIKKVGTHIEFTEEQKIELRKCKRDPIYFIRNYCKVVSLDRGLVPFELYQYQIDYLESIHNNRKVVAMFPRQAGKTITTAGYLLWYSVFNSNKNIAIMANKAKTSREILSRYQGMFEHLPIWMQQGVVSWNRGDVELENGSKVFTGATTKDGIRGQSCVTADTRVCIEKDDHYYYVQLSEIINNSGFPEIKDTEGMDRRYAVYKTTNSKNEKIYVGLHSFFPRQLIREHYDRGSCFTDGYLGSGKLIKRALECYNVEDFYQEIINVFDTLSEAEAFEREIVDMEFVNREDTYNVSLGGNVCVLYGDKNPQYGKTHTQETIDKIRETRMKNGLPTYNRVFIDSQTGEVYRGMSECLTHYCPDVLKETTNISNKRRLAISELVFNGIIICSDDEQQTEYMNLYSDHLSHLNESENIKKKMGEMAKQRFLGTTQSLDHVKKRINGLKKWIQENPDKVKDKMAAINSSPEKIKKTAEKHRGMKRSDETRKRIQESLVGKRPMNSDKVMICHPETYTIKFISKTDPLPDGWRYGGIRKPRAKKIAYNNGSNVRLFSVDESIPDGWVQGALPKPRKKK